MILRKSNKSNYIKVKIYQSIAFKNIIDKVIESIIIKIINYLIEIYELLSSYYYKEYSDRNTKNAMINNPAIRHESHSKIL